MAISSMQLNIKRQYSQAIRDALTLANAETGSAEAKRLVELIQAIEEYEQRQGWHIADDVRLSIRIREYRKHLGLGELA